ncbi:sigma-70 family RNA polymerase sigma factor [Mucilaginibacter sp. HMF5004]|uniref:RNA polymerase sigma factor n=1 Tax=Mucilaginibacter rivuli TaxID=2857527 RepID=UPI001C5DF956|nr:sigma-70 family RNA polymerase sigma factor [Mucilaginibacter rivuli]MBW4890685.1 sigma-70 family RNA polymerase sigma factor [Mucilaginibacter rivuli]
MNWFTNAKKPTTDEDDTLLKRYRESGDMAVLAELFKRYSSMVYYVCLRYLTDADKSKDATMQIFEELIEKINKHDIKQFSSWLYVLSRNHCLMQLRADKKMPSSPIDGFMELPAELHQDAEHKEKQLTALERCIEKLPQGQKQSIDLFFINEKCYKEITVITGYTLNEVKSYIQNGKRNLKICIEKNSEQ